MSSTLSRTRSEFSTGLWGTEPSGDATFRPADLDNDNDRFPSKRPAPGKRASRALSRFLIMFCMGVAATLAWQSYGDAAREMIASSAPQLGWLAPQVAPVAQTAPNMIAPAATRPFSRSAAAQRDVARSRRGAAKRRPARRRPGADEGRHHQAAGGRAGHP